MTSDEQRRAVAARLRGLRGFDVDGKKFCSCYDVEDALGLEGSIMCSRTAVEPVADLIDRPTCKTIEHGRPDESHVCKSCSRCSYGWFEDIHDKPYSYCPNCGAEVVNDD